MQYSLIKDVYGEDFCKNTIETKKNIIGGDGHSQYDRALKKSKNKKNKINKEIINKVNHIKNLLKNIYNNTPGLKNNIILRIKEHNKIIKILNEEMKKKTKKFNDIQKFNLEVDDINLANKIQNELNKIKKIATIKYNNNAKIFKTILGLLKLLLNININNHKNVYSKLNNLISKFIKNNQRNIINNYLNNIIFRITQLNKFKIIEQKLNTFISNKSFFRNNFLYIQNYINKYVKNNNTRNDLNNSFKYIYNKLNELKKIQKQEEEFKKLSQQASQNASFNYDSSNRLNYQNLQTQQNLINQSNTQRDALAQQKKMSVKDNQNAMKNAETGNGTQGKNTVATSDSAGSTIIEDQMALTTKNPPLSNTVAHKDYNDHLFLVKKDTMLGGNANLNNQNNYILLGLLLLFIVDCFFKLE